jgi:hypothetical protein
MKTVWMLGAGFSKQAGYPVISDFLDPSFFVHRLIFEELRGYSQIQTKVMMPEVEEWCRLDDDLNRLMSSFLNRADYTNTRKLNKFIMKTLDIITDYLRDVPTLPYLEAFVSHVGASNSSIISSNYDTLIEEMLGFINVCDYKEQERKGSLEPTYNLGIDSDTCKNRYDSEEYLDYGSGYLPFKQPTQGPIKILKIHGSTCLRYCQNCLNLIYSPPFPGCDPNMADICPHCKENTDQELLFVPPASDRSLTFWRLLAPLWDKAEQELMAAQNLVVMGYSLPREDQTARDMLARTRDKNPGIRVLIIDPFLSEVMCNRFREIFPNAIFLKETCKSFMGILISLRTKLSVSLSDKLTPEVTSFLLDLVSRKSSRPEGALCGTLPLGEDPLECICKAEVPDVFKRRVINMLGLCHESHIRETLFNQATSSDISSQTRANIAFALGGVADQKAVDCLNELLLEITPIEVPEWPLPNTISDYARSGLLEIAFTNPDLNFKTSLLYLSWLISQNILMEHHKFRALSAMRVFNSLPILNMNRPSGAWFGIDWVKAKQKVTTLRKTPRIFQDNEIAEMIKDRDFYDKFKNPEGKGAVHLYTAPFINGNWVVIDYASGLMWSLAQSSLVEYSETANQLWELKKSRYAGYSDWRLPTLEEALQLLEPPINDRWCDNPIFLRRIHRIWTSDRDKFPYVVDLFQGYCTPNWTIDNGDAFVRAVRSIDGSGLIARITGFLKRS